MNKGSFGGRGGRGDTMLKTVHRAIRARSAEDPCSNSNTNSPTRATATITATKPAIKNVFSLSSPSSINSLNLISSTGLPDYFDWESIDVCDADYDDQLEKENGFSDESVPSADEIQHAVSSLQQVLETSSIYIKDRTHYYVDKDVGDQIHTPIRSTHRVCSSDSELDWLEPPLHLCNSRTLESRRSDQVYDAFHLLQNDHSVQRMVISLSSDKAVWDAVMNNEVVREIRDSLNEVTKSSVAVESNEEACDGTNVATNVLSWIFINTKSKVMELIDKITALMKDLFEQHGVSTESTITGATAASEQFEKRVRASFMVSVVVLLIVVVGRSRSRT